MPTDGWPSNMVRGFNHETLTRGVMGRRVGRLNESVTTEAWIKSIY